MRQEVKDYIEEGNAIEVANGIYATQDSMYKNRITEKELEQYMIDEYGTVFTEDTTDDYYSKFSDKEIENLYVEWFGNPIDHYLEMEIGQMIDELIEDGHNKRK